MTQDEMIAAIETMTVLELSQLEGPGDRSASAAAADDDGRPCRWRGAAAAEAPAPVEEQTEFDVILKSLRRQQDQRHQGRARADQPGPEGSQGPGRGRSRDRADRRFQGRRGRCQGASSRPKAPRSTSSKYPGGYTGDLEPRIPTKQALPASAGVCFLGRSSLIRDGRSVSPALASCQIIPALVLLIHKNTSHDAACATL